MIAYREQIEISKDEIGEVYYQQNGHKIRKNSFSACARALWFSNRITPEIVALIPGVFVDTK